jgi:hypothetical protein
MKAGDMVRVRIDVGSRSHWHVGLLVEYHAWEKIATVLHEGDLLRLHASQVQKAGKRDFMENESRA